MDSDFLGVGWQFPLAIANGRVQMTRYEAAVRQSIEMILSTAPGERLMRPDFGCGIHDLVFATNGAETIGQIVSEVQRSLVEWEARIDVLDVAVQPSADNPSHLLIQINYQVRNTTNRFNLVYPFYLE
ncbi:GPW/gp25 family protein [Nodosilinea sp. FACHB-131]|uniref:GPW/gp25 family protein n=1 Tax=Cyanophyceae TaxID=3028117 RepID=UPI001684F69F|nr:GPW/gp25 family protein [Nodosilinea sp. FACHB-131]MBD1873792.1 GPW/gp25 family protein [Nodosilinea sp. FACHB-131]